MCGGFLHIMIFTYGRYEVVAFKFSLWNDIQQCSDRSGRSLDKKGGHSRRNQDVDDGRC